MAHDCYIPSRFWLDPTLFMDSNQNTPGKHPRRSDVKLTEQDSTPFKVHMDHTLSWDPSSGIIHRMVIMRRASCETRRLFFFTCQATGYHYSRIQTDYFWCPSRVIFTGRKAKPNVHGHPLRRIYLLPKRFSIFSAHNRLCIDVAILLTMICFPHNSD